MLPWMAYAQKQEFGKVVNEEGNTLKGAMIISAMTSKEVTTNKNGLFSLEGLIPGDTLNVYYAGYEQGTVYVREGVPVLVTLKKASPWDKTTPLLWYNKKRLLVTGAVNVLTETDLLKSPAINIKNALDGRVPGYYSIQTDASPGNELPSIYIRGRSGITDAGGYNSLVDGVERDYGELEASEIDQLVVLKDAISNAMYGSRGARKGVYVTTKRGQAYQNRISVMAQTGVQQPTKLPRTLGAYQYALLHNEGSANDGVQADYTQAQLDGYLNKTDPYLYPDVDWYDAAVNNTAMQYRLNLSASGGNKTARYFMMMGYTNQEGLLKYSRDNDNYQTGQSYQRYNFRTNMDVSVDANTLVQLDINVRLERRVLPHSSLSAAALWTNIASYPPGQFPVFNPNGSLGGNSQYAENPVGSLTRTGYQHQDHRFLEGSTRVFRKLDSWLPGLSAFAAFSFNSFARPTMQQSQDFAVYTYNGKDQPYTKFGNDVPLSAPASVPTFSHNYTFEGGLEYAPKLNGGHHLNTKLKYFQVRQKQPDTDLPYSRQLISGIASYDYNEKYIADVVVSYSGSENYAKDMRFQTYPAVGLSWIASKENMLKNATWLSLLKVRGSYGILGNDVYPSRFPYIEGITGGGTGANFGQTGFTGTGLAETTLGNPRTRAMEYKQANVGIDVELFNRQIALTVDRFSEKVNFIPVTPENISAIIGNTQVPANIGRTSNQGWEGEITLRRNWTRQFATHIRAQGAYYTNKIEYQAEQFRDEAYQQRTGRPLGQVFGLQALGFYKDQAEIDAGPSSSFATLRPGDLKYKDQNGDDVIDALDEIPLGNPGLPQVQYTFEIGARFRNFELTVLFTGVTERSLFLNSYASFRGFQPGSARPTAMVLGRWTPETADRATFPRLNTETNNHNFRNSTFWMRDGGFLRLKNVELAYNIPQSMLRRWGLQSGRIFATGHNLAVWSKFPDTDPESPAAGVTTDYPLLKITNLGVKIDF